MTKIYKITLEPDGTGWLVCAYDAAGYFIRCRAAFTKWGARRIALRMLQEPEVFFELGKVD